MTGKRKNHTTERSCVILLPGIYEETLHLLASAHDYFYVNGEVEQARFDERGRIMYASEMSRITIRLSCVMAWLMARKAVFSGKLSTADASANHRLDCRDVCLYQFIEAESVLPQSMRLLLGKSYELYQRVARLDDLVPTVPASS